MERFKWYRKMLGGKWIRLNIVEHGLVRGKAWFSMDHVVDALGRDLSCDEDWS